MAQPVVLERFTLLRTCCHKRWPRDSLEVVLLVALGEDERKVGLTLNMSDRSVRRCLERARRELSDCAGTSTTTRVLVTWFWLHSACCSRSVLSRFSRANRPEFGGY